MNDPGGALSQGTPSPNPTDMSKVADTVGDIVHWAFDTDETQLFCIQVMQDHSKLDPDGQIRGECIKYLVAKVQTEQSLFAAPAVVAEAAIQSNVVQAMRTNVVQFLLLDLDEASYERDRAQIAAKAGSFCAGLPRDACIWAVGHGDFDPKAGRLLAVVKQLQQVRGQQ